MKKTNILLLILTLFYIVGFFSAFSYLLDELSLHKFLDVARNTVEYSIMFLSLMVFASILTKNKFTSIFGYILVLLISLNFSVSISAAIIYNSGVNIGMILSIFDSNVSEAISMSSMFLIPSFIGILVLILSIYTLTIMKDDVSVNWKTLLLSSLWILMPFSFYMKHQYISNKGGGRMIKNVFYLSNTIEEALYVRKEALEMSEINPNFNLKKIDTGVQNIILVIGESARKQNFSLYGYDKNTTPYEDQEKNNMLIYENAVSPAGITNLSVPLTLSTIKPSEFKNNFKKIAYNIINLSNHTNYKTSWISMQGAARGITSIANKSNYKTWLTGYDAVAISHFKNVIDQKANNFVVIHLNGSHPNPCDRIPKTDNKNDLNCYDQSIKYTDKLLGDLFKFSKDKNTAIIYFSDHGLKFQGDKFLHTDSKESTQVPFFIWYSDNVAEKYRKTGIIKDKTQTTLIFPTIMKLMGLKEPENYKDKKLEYLKLDLSVIPYDDLVN